MLLTSKEYNFNTELWEVQLARNSILILQTITTPTLRNEMMVKDQVQPSESFEWILENPWAVP